MNKTRKQENLKKKIIYIDNLYRYANKKDHSV